MRVTVRVDGLKELDAALGELSKATARNVLKRVLKRAGQPIADAAKSYAPKDTNELAESIVVSPKIKNTVGNDEFAKAMKAGLGKDAAVSALRGARRAAKGEGSFAIVYVGPTQAKTKRNAIKRIVQEFGSRKMPAHPFMRPAWDSQKERALDIIKSDLGAEILKTAARVAKKAKR